MKQPAKYIEFKSPTQWITDVMAEIDPNLKTLSTIENGEKFADYMWDLYTIQCAEHNQPVKVYEVRFKFLASEYFHKNRRPMTQEIENNSIWVKKGFSPKTKYNIVNVSETTVYFYSFRTGTHYQYSIKNFLNKFQESQNAVQ